MHVKISILIPVFNSDTFIKDTLESVLQQTYNNWELLVVNDASTDNSFGVLQSYLEKDSRVHLINLEMNKGQGFARNLAIQKAKGNYIVFLDADDLLNVNALEILYNAIQKKPMTDVFVWGFKTIERNNKQEKTKLPLKPNANLGETPFKLGLLGRKGFFAFPWIYCVKKELIKRNNICFAEGIYFEDIQFSTQLLYFAQKVNVIKKVCYYYRKHPDSVTGKSSKQKIDDKFTAFTQIKTFLEGQKVFQHYQNLYLARFLALCVHTSFNEYFVLPKAQRDQELDDYMSKVRKSSLLRNENLVLLRNLGLSIPKNEKGARKAYLGAYYGLKAIRDHYSRHRFFMRLIIKIYHYRKGIK